MTNTSLDWLFPKPVYTIDGLCLDQLQEYEKLAHDIISNGFNRLEEYNVNTTNQVNNNVIEMFPELKKIILDYSKEFMQLLGYHQSYIDNATIADSTINISYGGDFLFPHTHGVCLLAGVFYIKTPPTATMWVYDDLHKVERYYDAVVPSTCPLSKSYECVPGRMILFQPDLIHGNKLQPEGEKIALPFKIN